MIKHVVVFKFKETATEEEIQSLEQSLGGLPALIPEIKLYEFGRDVLKTERSYDFALVSGFESLDTMQTYQVHPKHQEVLAIVKRICESIVAVDFNPNVA